MKRKLHELIFEADTPSGKVFDIVLLFSILLSVLVVILESVPRYDLLYGDEFYLIEWIITSLFTIEYVFRIYAVKKPVRYIFSFYGVIDLLSILPTYLGLFLGGMESLMVIRALRLIRVFRIFKLTRYSEAGRSLGRALWKSRAKISVFLFFVLTLVLIIGTMMYLIEGGENGFHSIPESVYWAIVTMTTVGYGDIAPVTSIGKMLASMVMIIGYAIIAVPTGIVSVEIFRTQKNTLVCEHCLEDVHEDDAQYCRKCGGKLNLTP
ncbi:ion transporter [Prolixibacteraceae bacterium JC049]|nr:ion transporter [Prolixibacteraceae bacterium JC049]